MEGRLLSSDDASYLILIEGVEARFRRGDVERVFLQESAENRYRSMRRAIKDEDLERLVLLAQWLQANRLYKEALHELDHVLTLDPNQGEAIRLKSIVLELLALRANDKDKGDPEVRPDDRSRERPARFPDRPGPSEFPYLTERQINLIKVFEIDLRDPPKVVIPRETVERMLLRYADNPLVPGDEESRRALLRAAPEKILELMFRLRAREFYEDVLVEDNPKAMAQFRDKVHSSWLINNCATTRCHGGSASGRLQLSNWKPNSERTLYTNFLILERFRTEDDLPLIDYENPDRSVLLELTLPHAESRRPHPEVPGWNPIFRDRSNRKFRQAVEWISSMYRPRPDYPIEYIPPSGRNRAGEEPGTPADPEPVER